MTYDQCNHGHASCDSAALGRCRSRSWRREWSRHGANTGLSVDPDGLDGLSPRADECDQLVDFSFDDKVVVRGSRPRGCQPDTKLFRAGLARRSILRPTGSGIRDKLYCLGFLCRDERDRRQTSPKRLILSRAGCPSGPAKPTGSFCHASRTCCVTSCTCSPRSRRRKKVEVFVLDCTDALWQVRHNDRERRNFIGFDGEKLWEFRRWAQGSQNGPLSCSGPSSFLLSCMQAAFTGMSQQPKNPDARAQPYIDDPAIAVRGPRRRGGDGLDVLQNLWVQTCIRESKQRKSCQMKLSSAYQRKRA